MIYKAQTKKYILLNNFGLELRDYVYIKDLIKFLKLLINSKFNGILNFVTGDQTKIIDIAIFEGRTPERSSKFYKFDPEKSKSVDKISQEVLNLLENQNLNESQKGEVVLKVLKTIMTFKNSKDEKLA